MAPGAPTLISRHLIPPTAMAELADGCTDRDAVSYLRAGQHSKNLMLLHALAKAAEDKPEDNGPQSRARAAFLAGYRLLAQVQAERPDVVARVLSLPHIGGWAHDGMVRLGRGLTPEFEYLARVAAAAALRAGVRFEPGIGGFRVKAPGTATGTLAATAEENPGSWIRLSSDGERLTTNSAIASEWTATPLIRAVADEHPWEVLLETSDEHLDRFSLRPAPVCDAAHLLRWLQCIQSAWQVLARQRIWALDAIADTVAAIIPLAPHHEGEFISETTPAAFGAIATTWPPDPVMMAETLIHEYQHLKLGALLDMVPLLTPDGGGTLVYAPWRQNPRPAAGLLQGIYAHLAVVRFWNAQRHLGGTPDDLLRAQVLYERWRPTLDGRADEAGLAYRAEILSAESPVPHSWVGLAVAARRVASPLLRAAFATSLPLMFEVHCCLASKGVKSDPMDLAAWLR